MREKGGNHARVAVTVGICGWFSWLVSDEEEQHSQRGRKCETRGWLVMITGRRQYPVKLKKHTKRVSVPSIPAASQSATAYVGLLFSSTKPGRRQTAPDGADCRSVGRTRPSTSGVPSRLAFEGMSVSVCLWCQPGALSAGPGTCTAAAALPQAQ